MSEPNVENILQNELTVTYGPDTYVFKIPSIKDRLSIAAHAAKLRKDSDPEGNGIALGYDPSAVILSDKLATFIVLLKNTSAKWVYAPAENGKPQIDIENWSDDVPVMEVIDQFNNELEIFRNNRNKS